MIYQCSKRSATAVQEQSDTLYYKTACRLSLLWTCTPGPDEYFSASRSDDCIHEVPTFPSWLSTVWCLMLLHVVTITVHIFSAYLHKRKDTTTSRSLAVSAYSPPKTFSFTALWCSYALVLIGYVGRADERFSAFVN